MAVVAATVTDFPPIFADDAATRMINENATSGDVGAVLIATDADGDTLAYSVAATGDTDAAAAHLAAFNDDFELDTATGQITVKSTAEIDFETRPAYLLLYRRQRRRGLLRRRRDARDDRRHA